MKKLRILIVDDSSVFRASVSNWIEENSKHTVVGMAADGREAIKLSSKLKPDLVLLDISMPEMDGLTAAQLIKESENPPKILICSIYDSDEYKERAKKVGVDGFLNKSELSKKLIPIIESIFSKRRRGFLFSQRDRQF